MLPQSGPERIGPDDLLALLDGRTFGYRIGVLHAASRDPLDPWASSNRKPGASLLGRPKGPRSASASASELVAFDSWPRRLRSKKNVVKLSAEERVLEALIHAGKSSAKMLARRARILLNADRQTREGCSDSAISQRWMPASTDLSHTSAAGRGEFEATLSRKYNPNSVRPRISHGAGRGELVALTCSPAPEGSLVGACLLEEKVVELNIVEKASNNTIGRRLKNVLKPNRNRQWVFPPEADAGFVAAIEDVLETYHRPRDPDRLLVCLDETSKQSIAETGAPIPPKPGRPARHDYEYQPCTAFPAPKRRRLATGSNGIASGYAPKHGRHTKAWKLEIEDSALGPKDVRVNRSLSSRPFSFSRTALPRAAEGATTCLLAFGWGGEAPH
jgi:hypothetical protein